MIGRKKPQVAADQDENPRGFDDYELRLGDIMRGERATLAKSLLDVQRELKIRANYIAAIENADPTAFETPGFIAGYVRSYARYLGMDPEWAYQKFCQEGNFSTAHGLDKAASAVKPQPRKARSGDPLADPNASFVPQGQAMLSRVEPGALGSLLVLVALIGGLGFGGWSVLKEIQQVELTPVEQTPGVLAEVDPLQNVTLDSAGALPQGTAVAAADPMERLYRPRALDVPVMVARDGPISSLEPGALSAMPSAPRAPQMAALPDAPQLGTGGAAPVQVVAAQAPELVMIAMRPAWVQVTSSDGAVVYEKIMDAGEQYVLPKSEEPPKLRTGYAGAIFFAVNGTAYGPVGQGGSVVKNVELTAAALTQKFAQTDLGEYPDVAQAVAALVQPAQQ